MKKITNASVLLRIEDPAVRKQLRNALILGLVCLTCSLGISQKIVESPTQNANAATQIANLKKTLEEAKAQGETLMQVEKTVNKSLEYLEKVNSNIHNLNRIKTIVENQKDIFVQVADIKKQFGKGKQNLNFLIIVQNSMNNTMQGTKNNIQELQGILNTGILNMSDNDRLKQIQYLEEETNKIKSDLYTTKSMLSKLEFAYKVYGNNY